MDLKERLTKIFEQKRVVVWYDSDNEFGETVDEWLPEGVEILSVQNNEFAIKCRVWTEKQKKFLLYSNGVKPDNEENWLLDITFSGYEFSAERVALWLQELGLPNSFRGFIEERANFFKNEARKNKLIQLLATEERPNEPKLSLMMAAVVLREEAFYDNILLSLLNDSFTGGDKFSQLQKNKLIGFINEYLSITFGFKGNFESIDDLALFLFKNEFEQFVPQEPGKVYFVRPGWKPAAASFFNNWMNNSRYRDSFDHFAKRYETYGNVKNLLMTHGYENFIECKAPECIEREIIRGISRAVMNSTILSDKVGEIIDKRLYFFYFSHYRHIYEGLKYALLLFENVKQNPPSFNTAEEGFKYYNISGYKTDTFYRKYYSTVKGKIHHEVLKEVTERVENIYLNQFIFPLEVLWKKAVGGLKGWSFQNYLMQNRFYSSFVQPYRGTDKRIFVVISDALRYEAASELTSLLVKNDRFEAKLEMMIGMVPSYTQIGMAALLPHERLSIVDGGDQAMVDGKSAGAQYRELRLKEKNEKSVVFKAIDFMTMSQEQGRDVIKPYEVIYIYHNKIDATGDDKTSEHDVFDAVQDAFEDIESLLRKIAAFNGTNVLITADHGFYYQESKLSDSQFIDVASYGNAGVVKRRVAFGVNFGCDDNVFKFGGKQLGLDNETEFLFPVGRMSFRLAGSGSRFVHGGLSIQEVVVPVIKFNKKRSGDTEKVNISIISKSSTSITTNNPVFDLHQNKSVSEKVIEREVVTGIYAPDGTLLSDEQTHLFNLKGNDARQLIKSVKFVMKGDISRYNNAPVFLRISDKNRRAGEDGIIQEKELFLNIAITNDFDDF